RIGECEIGILRIEMLFTLTRLALGDKWVSKRSRRFRYGVHSSRQWRPVFRGRGTGDAPVMGAPRFDRSHRHKVRLRHRPVRSLHRTDRWRGGEVLFPAG